MMQSDKPDDAAMERVGKAGHARRRTQKPFGGLPGMKLVGVPGFEPGTSAPRSLRITKQLRHRRQSGTGTKKALSLVGLRAFRVSGGDGGGSNYTCNTK
jgi:hypothetical protein